MNDGFWDPGPSDGPGRIPAVPHGPPGNVLGAVFGSRVLIAHGEQAAVSLENILVFRTGVSFTLVATLAASEHDWRDWGGMMALHGRTFGKDRPPTRIDPELLRFGVRYSDGGRATNVWTDMPGFAGASGGPVLVSGGGSAGGKQAQSGYWLTPLPPKGPVVFAVEWPAKGIAFTKAELDASAFSDAAEAALELWGEPVQGGLPSRTSIWHVSDRDEKGWPE